MIRACLDRDESKRPATAQHIIQLILEKRGSINEQALATVKPTVKIKSTSQSSQNVGAVPITLSSARQKTLPSTRSAQPEKSSTGRSEIFGLPIGRVGVLSFLGLIALGTITVLKVFDPTHSRKNNSVVEDRVIDATEDPRNERDLPGLYQKLVTSDDPLAHDMLVRRAREAKTIQERRLAEEAICNRAKRLGLFRSAEQMRTWLALFGDKIPQDYENLLRLVDPAFPPEQRESALKQAYLTFGPFIVKLSASLALDFKQTDQFQPILAPLVGDLLRVNDTKERSVGALILAVPETSSLYGDEALELLTTAPDSDLMWLLDLLGRRMDVRARTIAKMASTRKIIPPAREVLVDVITVRTDLPGNVLAALIKGARGAMNADDLAAIGTWYDLDAEKILLAICADNSTPEISQTAFDMLSGKSLSQEIVAKLFDWVRKRAFNDRAKLAPALGVLSLATKFPAADVHNAVLAFGDVAKDNELVKILLQSDSPEVLTATMETYGSMLDTTALLRLLSHPRKEVRIASVRKLGSVNDIGALKIILDNFKSENDEEVKQAYRESISVVRERESKNIRR